MFKTDCAKVTILNSTPLWIGAHATRTCWSSFEKSDSVIVCSSCGEPMDSEVELCSVCGNKTFEVECGEADADLIDRVGNKFKHASTLEHLVYNIKISDISRALLQELSRHRIASPSVKSTRYTLKELKAEKEFTLSDEDFERASRYLVWTENNKVNIASVLALENLRQLLVEGISNDIAKFAMPESYKTELTWTINARALQNFLSLRTSKSALWEIRQLAYKIYEEIPEEHKFIFNDCIYPQGKGSNEK